MYTWDCMKFEKVKTCVNLFFCLGVSWVLNNKNHQDSCNDAVSDCTSLV